MGQSTGYRPDVDGLRAIAVLSVVFYHAGWWPFSGGYVGVDVFFVISGDLITTILLKEIAEGNFSFTAFYERRIRRIIPALFVVLFVTSILSYLFLSPLDRGEFGETLIATIFFSSNFSLWLHSGGYFDTSDQLKPLLHTWSLSIEEQFYLFFPILLIAVSMIAHRVRKPLKPLLLFAVLFIFLLSFSLSVFSILYGIGVKTSFFLLPFRAWELGIGALLALHVVPDIKDHSLREGLAFFGLCIIMIAVIFYDYNTPFPGYAALAPCLGAGMIIHAGRGTLVGRFLSLSPVVFVGLISYSLYLWHWPLLSFMRIWNVEIVRLSSDTLYVLKPDQSVAVVLISFMLSILSWRYVERPFRGSRGRLNRKQIFSTTILSSCVFLGIGLYFILDNTWINAIPVHNKTVIVEEIGTYLDKNMKKMRLLAQKIGLSSSQTAVTGDDLSGHTDGNSLKPYVLLGDSHAMGLSGTLEKIARSHGTDITVLSFGGCWPVVGIYRDACELGPEMEQIIYRIAKSPEVHTVFIAARYPLYLYGATPGFPGTDTVSDKSGAVYALGEERRKIFAENFPKTIHVLLNSGKKIVLIYPIPEVGYDVAKAYSRVKSHGNREVMVYPMAYFWQRNAQILSILDDLGPMPGIFRVRPHEFLCDGQTCQVASADGPFYNDDNHLTSIGIERFRPALEAIFTETDPP